MRALSCSASLVWSEGVFERKRDLEGAVRSLSHQPTWEGEIMPETLEIDVEQVMERIRENIGKRRSEVPSPNASAPRSESQMPADFAFLQNGYDIYHINFTSHRKVAGRLVILAKTVLRKLLTPILERQLAFNAATASVARYLSEQVAGIRQHQTATLQTLQAEIAGQVAGIRQHQEATLQTLQAEIAGQVETLRQELTAFEQQQAAALQALRAEVLEQIQALRQQMENRLGDLELAATRLRDNVTTVERLQQDGSTHLESALTARDRRFEEWEKALSRLKTDHILQERRITVLLEETRKRLPEPLGQEQLQVIADEEKHFLEALYVSFEDQFRGTREDIKERLRVYLPLLEEAKLGSDQMPVLDVGCGRGEWLELLKEEGLRAHGVDLNRVLVGECRRRRLEVVDAEAVSYLSSLPQNSLGAVTGFHIIEHLPFDVLIKLLDETVRVLKPGGVAIFETPNPENVLVGSHNFYLDPTHRNPLPSATVKFIAEARGLCCVEIMNLHPYPESHRVDDAGLDIAKRFNQYFYGPQDYAVMGWKV
jgi:O-antigen chain-terminating methyltransferase